MQEAQPALPFRDHTILGVCEALGEDFRFNPLFLRVLLAVLLFWNPVAVVGGYLAMGAVVFVSRWMAPEPRKAAEPEAEPATAEPEPLPLAA